MPGQITCVMCGERGPASNEDVIPRWLARKLALKGKPPYWNSDLTEDGKIIVEGSRNLGGLPLPYKFPEVCKPCNEGWMSRLEQAMRHAAGRAIDGRPCTLHPFDLAVIATWMVKTSLLFDTARGGQVIPVDLGTRAFHDTGAPLPNTQVILAAQTPPKVGVGLVSGRQSLVRTDDATGEVVATAIQVGFVLDHLFIQTTINYTPDLPTTFANPLSRPYFVQVWPDPERIEWPTDRPALPPPDESAPTTT